MPVHGYLLAKLGFCMGWACQPHSAISQATPCASSEDLEEKEQGAIDLCNMEKLNAFIREEVMSGRLSGRYDAEGDAEGGTVPGTARSSHQSNDPSFDDAFSKWRFPTSATDDGELCGLSHSPPTKQVWAPLQVPVWVWVSAWMWARVCCGVWVKALR